VLKDRLKTSAILIAVILGLLYLDGNYSRAGAEGVWLLPLLLFFALGTAWDMSSLLAGSGRMISRRATLTATAIVTLSACVPLLWPLVGSIYPPNCPVGRLGWIVIGSVTAVFCVLIGEMAQYKKESTGTIERTCGAIFVSLYVGLPMALLVSLRSMGSGNWGLAALLTTIAVTKSTDAGAYFSGKAFGKHKLIPRLSPGKTREGAVGGILTATIVAFVCLQWLFPLINSGGIGPTAAPSIPGLGHPFWGAIVLGPLLALSGMVGDLAESLVKRDTGAKDSGNWLPGLGGVWDVTDSLIAAIMPAFLCFAAGVAG
jgi:phosphatidate cytidylyltransferase